jgi:membrane protease YdiL (CAAX protease family)
VKTIFVGPNGIRAGWRFAVFVFLFAALTELFNRILTGPLGYVEHPGWYPTDFLLDGALNFAAALLAAHIMSRLERRSLRDYGLSLKGAFGKQFSQGLLWGLVPSVVMVVFLRILGAASFDGLALHGRALLTSALLWGIAFLFLAFAEEFLYRGYSQITLAQGMGFWPAALLLSSLFGAVHYFLKPMETWMDALSVTLFGMFWCLTLKRTGSLWFAIGFHAMSDYADMVIFGEPNTGNHGLPLPGHLLNVSFHGPAWLTGGPCGTEASALEFLFLAGLFVLFNRMYPPSAVSPTSTPMADGLMSLRLRF